MQDFDDTFPIWFKVEKDLRDRVLKGGGFEENVWENKIGVMEAAHSLLADVMVSSRSSSPFTTSASGPSKKRLSTDDSNDAASKRQQRDRSSTPGASFRPPCCIVCAGPHLPAKHDNSVKTFEDGSQLFCTTDGRDVKTARNFKGPSQKSICITFNLGGGKKPCSHNDERVHACSLCGNPGHGALDRDPACPRVKNGEIVP
ncbi:hypothetical protein DFH08DRAFT_949916 [Mycena albidolilacea]|uniref:Uncharacterized protein n=1 Tax=Mycena albidolilacea TaxID=1033008 RepID=A0AAD7F399_9AGAR|nr:hypothetical protein DFH08DRAFT_949916 [Mycena albidolilacea]